MLTGASMDKFKQDGGTVLKNMTSNLVTVFQGPKRVRGGGVGLDF